MNEKAVISVGYVQIVFFSNEYHLDINNFSGKITDIVHFPHPSRLVGGFELFGNSFFFGKLIYQPKKESLCLFFGVGKLGMKLAGSEQVVIQDFAVSF